MDVALIILRLAIEYSLLQNALMQIYAYDVALARPDGPGRFAGITSPYFGGPGIRTPALERSLNSDKMTLFECTSSWKLRNLRKLFKWRVDRG